jgi:hypothetical protein
MSGDEQARELGRGRTELDSHMQFEASKGEFSGEMRKQDRQPPSSPNRRPGTFPVSVAIDPVALITTECITVASAMRKHARWAHSSVSAILGGSTSSSNSVAEGSRPSTPGRNTSTRKGHQVRPSLVEHDSLANRWGLRGKKGKSMQDNPLMAGFGRLRRDLIGCKGKCPLACISRSTQANILCRYSRF